MVGTEYKATHQPLLLLIVKPPERTVVFLCDTRCRKHIVAELLLFLGCIHNDYRHKEHTFISALQIFKERFSFIAIGGKVCRDYVHVITGAHCFFLLLDLHRIKVCQFPFNHLYGFRLVD
jgi:hypothetical protein